jgi:hypothetical protein
MHETVRAVERAFPISADQHACHYPIPDGKKLEPRYDLALWPGIKSVTSCFMRKVACLGALVSHYEAERLRDFAKVPGLIDTHPACGDLFGQRNAQHRFALRRRSILHLLRSIRAGALERSSGMGAAASSVKIGTENQRTQGDTAFQELPCEAAC